MCVIDRSTIQQFAVKICVYTEFTEKSKNSSVEYIRQKHVKRKKNPGI